MTALEIKQIKEEYANGKDPKEIAKERGVSVTTIYRCVKNVRRNVDPKAQLIKSVAEDYLSGRYSLKEVCVKYSVSETCVYNYIEKYRCSCYK